MTDRSAEVCHKPLARGFCTWPVGHDALRFHRKDCEYIAVYFGGRWVEVCDRCEGPLFVPGSELVTGEGKQPGTLECGRCTREQNDEKFAREVAAQIKEARRESLRR